MASKFKVGDKVRLIRNEQRYETRKVGDIGVVVGFGSENDRRLRVEVNDMVLGQFEHELELIVEPRFKVGDRVKFVKTSDSFAKRLVGQVGQIYAIRPCPLHDYSVKFDGGNGVDCANDDELEPIAPYAPRHTFASPSPSVAHIDAERIDAWMDDAVAKYKAQVTLGYEHPSHTTASGDALLIVENGQAKLYRLEGVKDVD